MDDLIKKRKAVRAAFTRAYKKLLDLLSDADVDYFTVNSQFPVFEKRYVELSELDSEIVNYFCKEDKDDDLIAEEMEKSDEYGTKYFFIKSKISSVEVAQTKSDAGSVGSKNENKLSVRLPRLELPKYNGDIAHWISFWAQFSTIDKSELLSNEEKFQYLIQATEPRSRARSVVESFPPSGENYQKAVISLKERFGRSDILIEFYIRELLKLVTGNSSMKLSNLYDKLETQLRALETLNIISDNYAAILLPMVESCLPAEVLKTWQRSNASDGESLKEQMDDLRLFLKKEVEAEERVALANGPKHVQSVQDSQKKEMLTKREWVATATALSNISNNCVFCSRGHDSSECYKAQEMTLEEKFEILANEKRCFACTRRGHSARNCRARCVVCKGRHTPVMCNKGKMTPVDTNAKQKSFPDSEEVDLLTTTDLNLSASSSRHIYLQTFLVYIRNGSKNRLARVLIDCGSQRTYITNTLAREMGYEPQGKEKLNHTLFGGNSTGTKEHSQFKIHLSSLVGEFNCCCNALDQETIAFSIPTVPGDGAWKEELSKYGIQLAPDSGDPVHILFGADVAGKLWTGGKRELSSGLVAIETLFGWTLMGEGHQVGTTLAKNVANTVTMLNIKQSDITSLWRLDVIGIEDPIEKKKKAERHITVVEQFKKNVRFVEGRYEVKLPWREDRVELPSNKEIVRGRLIRCTQKLKRSEGLFNEYDSIFRDWMRDGVIEETVDGGPGYYLPHRPVIKETSSTTRVRPVFDASAKMEGFPSLNDCLEEGPNLMELLNVVLMRSREKHIGVSADIKKAFLQIGIHTEDRDWLRFLWWKGDDSGDLITYRHARVVFGVTSCPFLLAAVLNYHFGRCLEDEQPGDILKILGKGFYVDNLATSLDSREEAENFEQEACRILEKAGFELRGWEFSRETDSAESNILGVKWDKRKDTLRLNMEGWPKTEFRKVFTKRSLLSLSQRIFDPIGFAVPATLSLRSLIQSLWERKLGWDEPVEEDTQRQFEKWFEDMKLLGEIKINRCLGFSTHKSLHLFCDASKRAYAAVVFVRSAYEKEFRVELIQAKSRVAPLKSVSIPRLELMAATIGARLLKSIRDALGWEEVPVYLWTDSSTVLAWIQRQEEWTVFVRNRIKEIRELTPSHRWQHISGTVNPADLVSRGCSPKKLLESRWWEGPLWLKTEEGEWPVSDVRYEEEQIAEEKLKSSICLLSTLSDHQWLYRYFSKFEKIIRMVAWMIRFCDNCRSKNSRRNGILSLVELTAAEMIVVRCVQEESFHSLSDERIVHLRPYIDPCGLIRIKTKIDNREDEPTFRSPVILPSKHAVVERMHYDLHCSLHHVGTQTLQSIVREKYWVVKGRMVARQTIRKCVVCRRFTSKKFDVESPPLPEARVRDGLAFEVTGVDMAGPLFLRDGAKVWICLFSCAIYRAIHLELVHSLSTESFIAALRRFVARRGRPKIIYSDNGTNFRGAANVFESVDWEEIHSHCMIQRIDWRFNPPTAAWWGGFWERMVRMVKQLIRKTLRRAALNLDELNTILCDCEAVINSRPLTPVSDTNVDPEPITPAMFLQGVQQSTVPECDAFENGNMSRRLRYRQRLREQLQVRFRNEYLGLLTWSDRKKTREPEAGEVVLIGDDSQKRINWPLAVIEDIIRGSDGKVRVLRLRTSSGGCIRPIQRVFPLEIRSEKNQIQEPAESHTSTSESLVEDLGTPAFIAEKRTRRGRKVVSPKRLNL